MPVELKAVILSDGQVLRFEEDIAPLPGPYLASAHGEGVISDFRSALDSVRSLATEIFTTVAALAHPPESCELTLGLKLSTEAGVIVAKTQGEANIGVKLSWKSISKPSPAKK